MQVWVFAALRHVQARLPFPLRAICADSGVELLNRHLVASCNEQHITFTRSRPKQTSDTCFVEQKLGRGASLRGLAWVRYRRGLPCAR